MAPSNRDRAPPAPPPLTTSSLSASSTANGDTPTPSAARVGPHPGFICSSDQFSSETKVRRMLRENGGDPSREDTYRLQGVQLIDNVREYLKLPVRTFDTACTYFHKFRLNFRDAEYNYQDAALASLFVACKVEDTIKKSKDILAAAYNVKNPDKPTASDDKIFESPGKIVIGLERLILETIGFDFRTRYPQRLLVKVCRSIAVSGAEDGRPFFSVAYAMCSDLYKTFIPIKRTTFAMVMAVGELTARLVGPPELVTRARELAEQKAAAAKQHQADARAVVVETMLDLLDLYVQHHKSTKLSGRFDLQTFMDAKIQLNRESEDDHIPRHLFHCARCENSARSVPTGPAAAISTAESSTPRSTSATSPSSQLPSGGEPSSALRRTARGQDGTMRFVYDMDAAQTERDSADAYFKEDFEEYEVEVEEEIQPRPPPPPQHRRRDDFDRMDDGRGRGRGRGRGGFHGGGGGGGGGYRDRGDPRWGGPYGRGGGGSGGGGGGDRQYRGRGRYHH